MLVAASSMRQRHDTSLLDQGESFPRHPGPNARASTNPSESIEVKKFLADYVRAYYTGRFDEVVQLIGKVPSEP
jgi:hypothetical protein